MTTLIKVARTARELDQVYWLRHEVYVIEDGKFGGQPLPQERISDRFDALPQVANLIAYEHGEPVGTLRINLDTGAGLPPEDHCDFSELRNNPPQHTDSPRFASGSMLAVREDWRRRRDVIQALFKTAAGVLLRWGASHILASVNHETVSIYHKFGFEATDEPRWIESIGNYVVPMAATYDTIFQWAFGGLLKGDLDRFWLDTFADCFERQLLKNGEKLFCEGDEANHSYIIDSGWIAISRQSPEGDNLTLATLPPGTLFGELALIEERPRSATATAMGHVELIRLSRDDFLQTIGSDPEKLKKLMQVLAQRLRHTDDLAMVMAYAPQTGRVLFALEKLKKSAMPERKNPSIRSVKMGPKELAQSAGVREHEVRRVLEKKRTEGEIEYSERVIKFLQQ